MAQVDRNSRKVDSLMLSNHMEVGARTGAEAYPFSSGATRYGVRRNSRRAAPRIQDIDLTGSKGISLPERSTHMRSGEMLLTNSMTVPRGSKVPGGDLGRRYIECMESSCFNIVRDSNGFSPGSDEKLAAIVIAIIKLHALCGGSIAIDAMGLSGSQVLLRLFADRTFLDFLAKHPHFIKTVSVYSHTENDRRAVALAGFRRALDPEWYSSTFLEQEPIIRLSEIILSANWLDPESIKSDKGRNSFATLVSRWPQYGTLLEGSLYAAWHFTENFHAPFEAAEPSLRVHELLSETLEKRFVVGMHKELIYDLKNFIENRCDSGISASHSEIIRAVQKHESDSKKAIQFLQTTSHAFNAGIFKSIKANYGAYEFFPQGAPIGLYLNSPRDVLVATNWYENETTRPLRVLRTCGFDWDPTLLRWADVSKVRDQPDALESGLKFQRACIDGDTEHIRDTLEEAYPFSSGATRYGVRRNSRRAAPRIQDVDLTGSKGISLRWKITLQL